MKIFTVATHSQNMYPYLEMSAKHFGHDFTVLGWNQKYKNHLWKDELMLEACRKIPNDEIVCFVDGFDSIICSSPNDIIHVYKQMSPEMSDIIMSVDGSSDDMRIFTYPLWTYCYWRVFPKVGNMYVNTGMYIAPAGLLVEWLSNVREKCSYDTNSNQLAWIRCINSSENTIKPKIDEKSQLFYNHFEVFSPDDAIKGDPTGWVRTKNGQRVHIVSIPGFRDSTPLLKQMYGGNAFVSPTSESWNTNTKIMYYIKTAYPEIMTIVILLVLMIKMLKK